MGIVSWIVFGALAGWVASIIANSKRQGCLFNVLIGVVGAFVGGFVMQFVTGENFSFAFNLRSFVVAVLGAIVLLVITGATRKK
ncbi:MAG: GlsB/YeaQ/YmgE family stress response membrane protein [Chloroflexota bacterium]|nr:GlsB/YeaQ/YmgE family stress response membrane protein [Anaerolineales bacterium]MCA9975470.1 GlsB/YeaQ/YmgE family stress response membrane protein [Anaerolineales bacterium]